MAVIYNQAEAPSGIDNAMEADGETTEVCDSAALLRADPDEALSSGGGGSGILHEGGGGIEHLQRAAGMLGSCNFQSDDCRHWH